jgi:23S rRNA (adenine2503-C2)-methyltransferase
MGSRRDSDPFGLNHGCSVLVGMKAGFRVRLRDMKDVRAMTLEELAAAMGSRTRALVTRRWLYGSEPVPTALPERIHGVTPSAWARLRSQGEVPRWEMATRQRASDGTVKIAIVLEGGQVECVLIPGERRSTVCVSSQMGCTRRCTFCATARLGFTRQLTPGEIILQYLVAAKEAPRERPARNVVFMGMGEPLDNLDAVLAAENLLLESPVPGLAAQHVTVSTSGVVPGMRRFLAEGQGRFALSLSATTDEQRAQLIPHARRWPIADLLQVLRDDPQRRQGRRHFIAYVMWDGVNDDDDDARRLVALLAGLPAHVNLIAHNVIPDSDLRPSPPERVEKFRDIVHGLGVRCLIRQARGPDIAAACGQLALLDSQAVPLPAGVASGDRLEQRGG